jgi:hypothetical protein
MDAILCSGLIGGCMVVLLKILHQWFLLVFRQEPARNERWLKLSPIWNGQGTSKEAYLGQELENSYSFGTACSILI